MQGTWEELKLCLLSHSPPNIELLYWAWPFTVSQLYPVDSFFLAFIHGFSHWILTGHWFIKSRLASFLIIYPFPPDQPEQEPKFHLWIASTPMSLALPCFEVLALPACITFFTWLYNVSCHCLGIFCIIYSLFHCICLGSDLSFELLLYIIKIPSFIFIFWGPSFSFQFSTTPNYSEQNQVLHFLI